MASSEETKAILERNRSALNNRDMNAYLENQTSDGSITLTDGTVLKGAEAIRQFTEMMWGAFPDAKITFGDQVLSPDAAATEVIIEGTHTGPLPGPDGMIEPTGKKVKLHSLSLLKIRDGKIASERVYNDSAEMMHQLGLMG